MLKQSASRNLRGKSLKVKHALQIFVVVAVFVWLLYHFKHSHHVKSTAESDEKQVLKMGRKQLKPQADEVEKQVELMEKLEEMDIEGEKEVQVEVEHDQMQDFIDEDDKDQLLVEA